MIAVPNLPKPRRAAPSRWKPSFSRSRRASAAVAGVTAVIRRQSNCMKGYAKMQLAMRRLSQRRWAEAAEISIEPRNGW